MKICIAGKNNIAVEVTSYLIKRYGKNNLFVIPNASDNEENNFQRSFKQFSKIEKIKIVRLEDVYEIDNLLFLSLEFDKIIKPEKFSSNRLFNLHFSLLPKYKGMYTSAIPLLNGEKISGVTLHRIDAGIDTGEIIAQKKIKITKKDNAKTLYLKYIKYGIELVKEQIDNLMEDKIKSKKQSSFHSTYYSRNFLDYSNLKINLTQTAWQINQTIRAFCFRDYQLPEIYSYKIIHCKILKTRSNCKPGNILEDKEDRLILSTIDYNICLIKDQLELIFELCKKDTIRELKKVQDIHLYINEKNLFGKSLLMECAYYNSKKTFKYLISKGADLNSIDYNGKSVLMYVASGAILTKDTEILKYILDNKGDIHHKDFSGKDIFHNIENHSSEAYHLIKKYYD